MPVRAVTPRVVAISGHVQIHGASCAGDCCNYDRDQDERAVGDTFDPEWPDKPLRLGRHRASNARPGTDDLSADPMNAPAPKRAGRDGRAAGAASSSPRESERRPLFESADTLTWPSARNDGNAPGLTPATALNPQAVAGSVDPGCASSASGAAASPTGFTSVGGVDTAGGLTEPLGRGPVGGHGPCARTSSSLSSGACAGSLTPSSNVEGARRSPDAL